MKHYVLVPDSFKGTLSSAEVCGIMRDVILRSQPDARVTAIPVADGGEGSVDAFLTALGGEDLCSLSRSSRGGDDGLLRDASRWNGRSGNGCCGRFATGG